MDKSLYDMNVLDPDDNYFTEDGIYKLIFLTNLYSNWSQNYQICSW